MAQRRGGLRFQTEATKTVRIARKSWGQNFDCDITLKLCVAGAIDLAHATRTDPGDNFIGAKTRPGSEPHGTDSTRTS